MAKVFSAEIAAMPVNVTTTPVAGGTLDIGKTYYYRIVHVGPGHNYSYGDGAMWWRSIPSVEVSATTDAVNRTIRLEWDKDLADTAVAMVFRTEVSGDYTVYDRATGVWKATQLRIGSSARAYGELIGNLIDLGAKWGWEDNGSKTMAYSPIIESGVPRITMSGGDAGDPITPTNIADWMVVNGHSSRVDILDFYTEVKEPVVIKMRATIQNSGVTYFSIRPRQHFVQEWGKFWVDANCTVKIGDRNVGEPNNGAIWHTYTGYAWYSGFQGELEMNDTVVWGMPIDLAGILMATGGTGAMFHLYNGNNPCGFYSSIYGPGEYSSLGRLAPTNLTLSNSFMKIQNAEIIYSQANLIGSQMSNPVKVCFQTRQLTFVECFTSRTNTYDVIHMNSYNTFDNCGIFIDCDFVGYHSDGILPYMNKDFNAAISSYMDTMIMKSINLSVADEDGNPMQGAVMTIKDSTGYGAGLVRLDSYVDNDVYTGTALTVTDATNINIGDVLRLNLEKVLVTNKVGNDLTIERQYEGSLLRSTDDGVGGSRLFLQKEPESDINGDFEKLYVMHDYHTIQQDGSSGNHFYYPADFVSVNPITITISKPGYWDYETKFDLSKPISDTIGMIPLSDFLAAVPIEVEIGESGIDVEIGDSESIIVEVDCG